MMVSVSRYSTNLPLPNEFEPTPSQYLLVLHDETIGLRYLVEAAQDELRGAAQRSTDQTAYFMCRSIDEQAGPAELGQEFPACRNLLDRTTLRSHRVASRQYPQAVATPATILTPDFLRVSFERQLPKSAQLQPRPLYQEAGPYLEEEEQSVKWRRIVNLGALPVSLEFAPFDPSTVSETDRKSGDFAPGDRRFVLIPERRQIVPEQMLVESIAFPAKLFHTLRNDGQLVAAYSHEEPL